MQVKEEIIRRIEELEEIIRVKEAALSHAPKGVINIASNDTRTQYLFKEKPSSKYRKYLKIEEVSLVHALCQKDYDEKILQAARKELKSLEYAIKNYPLLTCEDIYSHLNFHRQKHVTPIILPDEEFVKQWEQVDYPRMGFSEDYPEYYTDKEERVRSKTEIFIANALNKHNIPYKYECPLYLNGYGTVHPDFTVLNVRLRKEIYWEHMGMMDNPEYTETALQKIETYQKNDIFPGDRLILTHETSRHPLNSRIIEKMIFQYLK